MQSNVTDAMGELIRQQTTLQLARDWEKAEAEMTMRRERFGRIRMLLALKPGLSQIASAVGVVREARA